MNRKESEENKQPNGKDIVSSSSGNENRMVGCCHCKTKQVKQRDNIFEADQKAFEQEVCHVVIDQYLPRFETHSTPTTTDGVSCRPMNKMGNRQSNRLIRLSMTSRHHRDVDDQNGCNNLSTSMITNHKSNKQRCSQCRRKRIQRVLDEAVAITTEVHQIMMTKEEHPELKNRL